MRATQSTAGSSGTSGSMLLVQKCSCGKAGQTASGKCEECRKNEALGLGPELIVGAADDPFEREADRAAEAAAGMYRPNLTTAPVARVSRRTNSTVAVGQRAPGSVSRAIQGPGEPLGSDAQSYFGSRLGHDFGHVRIHRDAEAAASAREIAARAYTVGHHVVFGAGSFSPETPAGRKLIAHELAHVIQQRGTVQRDSISPEQRLNIGGQEEEEEPVASVPVAEEEEAQAGTMPEEDEEELQQGIGLVQRIPLTTEFNGDLFADDPLLADAPWPEKLEAAMAQAEWEATLACIASTPPDPAECDPGRALTWADFTGTMPAGSQFGASTFSGLRLCSTNSALLRCMPQSSDAADANPQGTQAFFDPARSRVKDSARNPADPASNGCQRHIDACEQFFDNQPAGSVGAFMAMSTNPSAQCPASPTARGDRATSRDECSTILGEDCKDQAVAESSRLLAHEQGHFDLSCAMARKANALITKDTDVDHLLRSARRQLRRQQRRYDRESRHGCNAAQQANWEQRIADGLPDVALRARNVRPRGRRRRGGERR